MRWISTLVVPLALFTGQAAASVATPQDANAALAEAQVSLFKALGGGWEQAPESSRR